MGLLIDENVDVQITRRNRKYYREKGYNIPDCYEGNFAIKAIDINPKSIIQNYNNDYVGVMSPHLTNW